MNSGMEVGNYETVANIRENWTNITSKIGEVDMEDRTSIKYQVFVSSTYVDLIEERKEITQAILEANCIPAGMELFPASNKSQWDFIKKVIYDSDFYLVILAICI